MYILKKEGLALLKYTIGFIQRGHEILMLNRNNSPAQGLWHGVGGKLEPGEDPEQCIIREILEETGIRLTPSEVRFTGIVTWEEDSGQLEGMYAYIAELDEQFTFTTPFEIDEGILAWKTLEWIVSPDNYGVGGHVRRFLPIMLFDNQCYEHRCTFESGRLTNYELIGLHT